MHVVATYASVCVFWRLTAANSYEETTVMQHIFSSVIAKTFGQ